jgi:hypothetical protein
MSKSTYNGWTNYATWRINLEIFDGLDQVWDADEARQYVEDYIHASSSGIARDYALAFISDVNWHEIAAHYQEETA